MKFLVKILVILLNFLVMSNLLAQIDFSQREKYLQINNFLSPEYDEYQDISHIQLVPQFENNQSPDKAATLEISYAEVDNSEASQRRIQWLQDQIKQARVSSPDVFKEVLVVGNNAESLKEDGQTSKFLEFFAQFGPEVTYEQLPQNRQPSGAMSGRTLWTLIRFASSTSGAFMGLYFMKDVPADKAFAIGAVSGIASGALTYFSGAYGRYLTSGAWSTWLLESETTFARGLKKAIGISASNSARMLEKFKGMEKHLKWWINTNAYTTIAIKIPQAVGGVAVTNSLLQASGDIVTAATMNFFAQGPGSIAIEVRKYQMVEELELAIRSGNKVVENKKLLLDEIAKVLAKEGKFASYVIHEGSHPLLKGIENWARGRQTMLSFFSVVGVALDVAGVPLGKPVLIATGIGGGFYYTKVNGSLPTKKTLSKYAQKLIQPFVEGKSKLLSLPLRHCYNNFTSKL